MSSDGVRPPSSEHVQGGTVHTASDGGSLSSALTIDEVRQGVREYSQAIARVDTAISTLKPQLIHTREQDLHLLKQLIGIGDTIRRLSRSHDRHFRREAGRVQQELMTSAVDVSVTLRRTKGRRGSLLLLAGGGMGGGGGGGGAGDYGTVPLVRRQSEPQVCLLSPHGLLSPDARSWGSRRGSGSSADWYSEDTLGSSDDGLDTLDSDEDLDITTTTRTLSTIADMDNDNESTAQRNLTVPIAAATQDNFQRPKSHSVVAGTFMSRPNKLTGGNNAYSDILNKNVRLWKDRLETAQGVRQKVSILEEES